MRQGIRQNGPYRLQRTSRRDQRMHPSPMRPATQMLHQLRQNGWFVAKQAQHVRIIRHTQLCAPGGAVKRLLPQQQTGLAQQAAGLWRKAGIEKVLHTPGSRAAHHWRGQPVKAFRMAFCRQVFQVEPHTRMVVLLPCPACLHRVIKRAAKCLDQHVGWRHWQAGVCQWPVPGQHLHACMAVRRKPLQGRAVINP